MSYFVLLFSFLESIAFVGIIIPGSTILAAIGFFSTQGFFQTGLIYVLAALGAIIGDSLSYFLGRNSHRIFKTDSKIYQSNYFKKGKDFFEKHGKLSLILGRMFGPLRAVVPFVSGVYKMAVGEFIFYDVLAALIWAALYLYFGFFLGEAWQAVSLWSNRLAVILFWIFIFLVVFYFLKWLIIKKGRRLFLFLLSLLKSVWEGIKEDQNIKKIVTAHPAWFVFLKNRLDRKKFSGLPLTILVLVFIYCLSEFLGMAIGVIKGGNILDMDFSLGNLLYVFRDPVLSKIFIWITLLGSWQMASVVLIVFFILFIIWQKRALALALFISVLGGAVTSFLLKNLFHRPRPAGVLPVYFESSWSFPSAHAVLAVSLYGFLIYFFWKHLKKWKNKINVLFLGLLVIIAIGFSRLYLGVHYFSDVWAGYMLGMMWLIMGISIVEGLNYKTVVPEKFKPASNIRAISVVLIWLLLLFYLGFIFIYKPPYYVLEGSINAQVIKAGQADKIFSDFSLSKFTETLLGNPQEPFSLIVIAKDDNTLKQDFNKIGWYAADDIDINSLSTALRSEILNKPYPSAPMTPYFWRTFPNDFGFEKPTGINSVRYRHHARFWRTDFLTDSGEKIYIGFTSLDTGVKWWGLTHTIKPDIDTDREFLLNELQNVGLVSSIKKEQFIDPVLGKNFTGDQYFTDGQIYTVYLK